MGKKPKGKKIKAVDRRIAREAATMAARRAEARYRAVYGRKDEPTPPEVESESVKAIPTAFESNRQRH